MALSSMSKSNDKGQADWATFEPISDGWHGAVFAEGITLSVSDEGKRRLRVPFKITEDSEDNNKQISVFINIDMTSKKTGEPIPMDCKSMAERRFADIVIASGKAAEFDKTFGAEFGETLSPFDSKIIDRVVNLMAISLTDVPLWIKVHGREYEGKTMPDVVGLSPIAVNPTEKGSGSAQAKKTSSATGNVNPDFVE